MINQFVNLDSESATTLKEENVEMLYIQNFISSELISWLFI